MSTPTKIRWAPKVRPERILRLYEEEAAGRLDEELLLDVGWALLARCGSIVLVNDGQVLCPECRTVFKVERTYRERAKGEPPEDPERAVPCPGPGCGWGTTVGAWGESWRHRELHAGWGLPSIRAFAERYPLAATPPERMLLIDQLLHAFHHDLRNSGPHRTVAHNLIEGSHQQALALLDALAMDTAAPERRSVREAWQAARARLRRG
jgi:hypothetical protein